MNKKQIKEFEKRYAKFKENNLPTPFFDKERQILEYVHYEDESLELSNSIYEALSRISYSSLYYPFTSGHLTGSINDNYKLKYEVGHNHAHSFEEVVSWLYDYPESFSISKDEEKYYSKQELKYLKEVQEYLLFIGLKDCKTNKRPNNRFKNSKQAKYKNYGIINCSNELSKKILTGKRNYLVINTDYPDIYPEIKEYTKEERVSLVRNEEGRIIALIEFTHSEKKKYYEYKDKYQEIHKDYYTKKEIKDNDYVIIEYFKVIKKF